MGGRWFLFFLFEVFRPVFLNKPIYFFLTRFDVWTNSLYDIACYSKISSSTEDPMSILMVSTLGEFGFYNGLATPSRRGDFRVTVQFGNL